MRIFTVQFGLKLLHSGFNLHHRSAVRLPAPKRVVNDCEQEDGGFDDDDVVHGAGRRVVFCRETAENENHDQEGASESIVDGAKGLG